MARTRRKPATPRRTRKPAAATPSSSFFETVSGWFGAAPKERLDPAKPKVVWTFRPTYAEPVPADTHKSALWKRVFDNKSVRETVLTYKGCTLARSKPVRVTVSKADGTVTVTVQYNPLADAATPPAQDDVRTHFKRCLNDWIEQDGLYRFAKRKGVEVQRL